MARHYRGRHGGLRFTDMTVATSPSRLHRLAAPVGLAALGVCGCVALRLADPSSLGSLPQLCPTKLLLDIDCPGCGALRMMYALTHGDVLAALRFNAVALVGLVLVAVAFGVWTYGRAVGRPVRSWQHHRWAAAVTLAVVMVWFVVRNIPWPPFTALHV